MRLVEICILVFRCLPENMIISMRDFSYYTTYCMSKKSCRFFLRETHFKKIDKISWTYSVKQNEN